MNENTNVVKNHFSPWSEIECWVLSNNMKQPCTIHDGEYKTEPPKKYKVGDMLRWKEEPQDHISTLNKIIKVHEMLPGYGFGILLGLNNNIGCFDFDHALDESGNIINQEVKEFIEVISSFTEISTSGKGLHIFVSINSNDKTDVSEFSFKKTFGDGKFYCGRFIKMTGNCPDDFNLPVKILEPNEFWAVRKRMSNEAQTHSFKKIPKPIDGEVKISWDDILTEVGIIHTKSQYFGKSRNYPDGSCKVALESYRIPCPNRHSHTNYSKRTSQFGPDAAILTKWDDGTSSCTCNHNACAPEKKPNLLQNLWDEINNTRYKQARSVIEEYSEVFSEQ